MAVEVDADLGVDVLVIGGGIQGSYIASELARDYSVCVVADPAVRAATLDAPGYFSAGYDGNDANRIQPARRAAGWWRLWAESNQVPFVEDPPWYVVPAEEEATRTRLWSDATLSVASADALPEVLAGGALAEASAFRAGNDLVLDPATVLGRLRSGVEASCIEGEILRFGLFGDEAIDHVQVQVAEQVVPIVPRFVVLAAGVGNASLLSKLASRLSSQAARKAAKELVGTSQAVRTQHVVGLTGAGLPELSGHFAELEITSQRLAATGEVVWLVAPPIDDAHTTLGPENLRFDRPLDPALVGEAVRRLFEICPAIGSMAPELRWSSYVTRHTQHPSLATGDLSRVAQPVPAKLERFGLDAFLAVWPSHLAYAQVVGDAVAERIAEALGPAQDFSDGPQAGDLEARLPAPVDRWNRPGFEWHDWAGFQAEFALAD